MYSADSPDELAWKKSSRSATNGNCVEVAMSGDGVAVRDSKHPHGGILRFDAAHWRRFLAAIGDSSPSM